jgi:DNA helicase-2/ATP-dependent DNA helicase PcrA
VLERDDSPEAEARLENLKELLTAAAEATERGEGIPEFLDHAALVSEADSLDERAQVSLLTLHNAKGLEFPIVFIAGLEQGLLPHSRSMERPDALEEERRLCYVGMTRARQRLFLSWARVRRRWAGDDWEPSDPSQFLLELPAAVTETLGERPVTAQVDLFPEQHAVRETVRKSAFPGKTYNSLENIAEFFAARGMKPPPQAAAAAAQPKVVVMPRKRAKGLVIGAEVVHPTYGRGTIVRREGFHKHGLVKLIERYASLKTAE